MESALQELPSQGARPALWWPPTRWFAQHRLSRGFWLFFFAAFFFDAGFAVYYFLFNLYLVDLHFTEKAIGLINGAATLGAVIVTLPAGMLARRWGVRPVMMSCFLAAPFFGVLRAIFVQETAQIVLGCIGGMAIGLWGICFLPAVTRLTREDNRAAAFGLIFSVSVGTSALGSVLCGYLPKWIANMGLQMDPYAVKRLVLVCAACFAAFGFGFVLRLRIPHDEGATGAPSQAWRHVARSRFLWTMLPLMALWAGLVASFAAFGGVYFARGLQLPIERIGLIFSLSQLVQLGAGMLSAPLFRALGLQRGIALTQVTTAALLLALAAVHQAGPAAALYLCLTGALWMSSPGLYNLLMSGTPDRERSSVASFTMFLNAVVTTAGTAIAGVAIMRLGYGRWFTFLGVAAAGLGVWMAFASAARRENGVAA